MTTDKTEKIDLRQDAFCVHYTTVGAETFAHAEKSALAAGYSETSGRNRATELLKQPEIWRRINELHEQNMKQNAVTVASVIADIRHDRDAARAAGKTADALAGDKLLGQYLALFSDRLQIDEPAARAMSEREAEEVSELARLRLGQKYGLTGMPKPQSAGVG